MAYATPSDSLIRYAAYGGLAVFLATAALLMAIAVIRYLVDYRLSAERRLTERWQPVFFQTIEGMPVTPPRITGRDREAILLAWLHFTESIRGEARLRLRQLALELKLDRTARKLLARRNVRSKLLAVAALGRLGCREDWDQLAMLVGDDSPTLSLLAVRALLQIDAARGLPLLFEALDHRDDWPVRKVAAMLGEAPQGLLGNALVSAIGSAGEGGLPRLLALAALVPAGDLLPVLAPLLTSQCPEDIVIAALKASSDPRVLDAVRTLATDDRWTVRAQAATTLGRLGLPEDRLRLQAMLADREWWVRYRAAQALVRLPSSRRTDLEALCGRIGDRFAADMLRQALAETA